MNKAQLVDAIAAKTGLTKVNSKKALDAIIEATADVLKKGERITLIGFGTFVISERKKRNGRNPQTGKQITIPAKKAVRFKPGGDLSGQLQ